MDQKADKKLEEFTEKLMQDFSLESPAIDFTTKVMSRVEGLSDSKITTYQPIISKRIWWLLGISISGVIAYFTLAKNNPANSTWLSTFTFNPLQNSNTLNLINMEISSVGIYAIMGFTFFVSIQILILKNHFNKRLA
ncbi:hypothetical protein [Aurantibacter sp.]|uniref:hypothetical protein n=1 Tax=Aurantibacter sp. TaxID=2807103 RepID=UPI00326385D5